MTSTAAVLKPKVDEQTTNSGLAEDYRREMAATLSDILAAAYRLTIKSHIYHWNVVGPLFKPLHDLTEEHYQALFEAIDEVAERIRAIGHTAPLDMTKISSLAPSNDDVDHRSARSMIDDLIDEHESASRTMRKAAGEAGDAGDVVTEDMLTQMLTFHEKAVWMLRATAAS